MADKAIPAAQQSKVSADFERVEHEETGEGVHEKYLALAQKLANEVRGWDLNLAFKGITTEKKV
jgi:hemerythrin-like domain-containing protein